jgi:hypothetical protein
MNHKLHTYKVFNVITLFFLATLLLSACGGFSFQAQAAPSQDGGVGITGGVDPILPADPAQPAQPAAPAGQTMNPTTVILLLAGFGVLVLILVLLVLRPSTTTSEDTPRIP